MGNKAKGALTTIERKFVEEYVKDYNATQAYLRTSPNATYNTANSQGPLMLKRPYVMDAIKEIQEENVRRYGDIASVLIELLIANATQLDENGKHNSDWQKSVDLLQKQLGLQNQKVEMNSPNGFKINIIAAADPEDTTTLD